MKLQIFSKNDKVPKYIDCVGEVTLKKFGVEDNNKIYAVVDVAFKSDTEYGNFDKHPIQNRKMYVGDMIQLTGIKTELVIDG